MTHELLTPLNSATLGLKLLLKGIHRDNDNDDGDDNHENRSLMYDTAMDVSSSISSAVALLESLSFYDKIDNGLLQLKMENDVNVVSFLEDCVLPFSSHANQAGVNLCLTTDMPSDPEHDGTSILLSH
jgi:signal transduction histidine kinase